MAMTAREWTVSALTVELGVDRRTLSKRLASVTPIREKGRARYYRLRDVVRAIYLLDADAGSYEAERTRLTKAQATRAVLVSGSMGWLAGNLACLLTGVIGRVRLDNGSRVS